MFKKWTVIACGLLMAVCAGAQQPDRVVYRMGTANAGGAFAPYGTAFAQVVAANSRIDIATGFSKGSNESINLLEKGDLELGLVNLGPALEAIKGLGPWQGRPVANVRAALPMYESTFQFISLRRSGISSLAQLAGKRIGVGPKGVPAEMVLKTLLDEMGMQAILVNGDHVGRGKDLLSGEIDAIWIGASLPVAELKDITDKHEATVFGLTAQEIAAFLKRVPYASPYVIEGGTYRGQNAAVNTVAIWNFVMVRADLPESDVKSLVLAALKNTADLSSRYGPATSTRASNATANTVVPFHPGAVAALRELGVQLP